MTSDCGTGPSFCTWADPSLAQFGAPLPGGGAGLALVLSQAPCAAQGGQGCCAGGVCANWAGGHLASLGCLQYGTIEFEASISGLPAGTNGVFYVGTRAEASGGAAAAGQNEIDVGVSPSTLVPLSAERGAAPDPHTHPASALPAVPGSGPELVLAYFGPAVSLESYDGATSPPFTAVQAGSFTTYRVVWGPGSLDYYVDGVLYRSVGADTADGTSVPWRPQSLRIIIRTNSGTAQPAPPGTVYMRSLRVTPAAAVAVPPAKVVPPPVAAERAVAAAAVSPPPLVAAVPAAGPPLAATAAAHAARIAAHRAAVTAALQAQAQAAQAQPQPQPRVPLGSGAALAAAADGVLPAGTPPAPDGVPAQQWADTWHFAYEGALAPKGAPPAPPNLTPGQWAAQWVSQRQQAAQAAALLAAQRQGQAAPQQGEASEEATRTRELPQQQARYATAETLVPTRRAATAGAAVRPRAAPLVAADAAAVSAVASAAPPAAAAAPALAVTAPTAAPGQLSPPWDASLLLIRDDLV